MTTETMADVRMAVETAALAAGCDVASLRIDECVIERTWGDRCGLLFSGPCAARAAAFFARWAPGHLPAPRYPAQASNGSPQPLSARVGGEVLTGIAVSYVYYPCGE